jgi:hypothetical protein
MNCKDCRHWGKAYEYYDFEADADTKAGPHRRCGAIGMGDIYEKQPADKPFVRDGSGYLAELYTPSVFGCVLFEAKTTEKEAE